MHYYVNGTVPGDGYYSMVSFFDHFSHFRVVIGYDDVADTIILNDPW
jgi:hypothetical protein